MNLQGEYALPDLRAAACYLCGGREFHKRPGSVRDAPALQVLECDACGLVTLSSHAHVGPDHYERSGMHGAEPLPIEVWLRETEVDDDRRFRMFRGMLDGRRVLDFGSGAGGFLRRAGTVAREAVGVEPERRVHEHWKKALALHPTLDSAGSGYDIVTAFHVLEHMPDPRATLLSLGARLSETGKLIVEVPSADDALLTLFECEAFRNFTYWSQHLFLFTTETLRRLIQQAGLDVVSVDQFQRYPLSNHLYWLSQGKPGGHVRWAFLDSAALHDAYSAALATAGKCDTLIATIARKAP